MHYRVVYGGVQAVWAEVYQDVRRKASNLGLSGLQVEVVNGMHLAYLQGVWCDETPLVTSAAGRKGLVAVGQRSKDRQELVVEGFVVVVGTPDSRVDMLLVSGGVCTVRCEILFSGRTKA